MSRAVIITGCSGLIGSACVRAFARLGWLVHGVDNNMRATYFGPDGDTSSTLRLLKTTVGGFVHYAVDVRERSQLEGLFRVIRPSAVIHCAAQPSHEWAAVHPVCDFEVNVVGTVNVLEAMRQACPEATLCFASTNKVYGDRPNTLQLRECETRWECAEECFINGIDESLPVDQCLHSVFGAGKLAADIMVQEYGRYYDMATICVRLGCVTGALHAGCEVHGFLAYLARCVREGRPYRVYGHKGKQVRDNIHAEDVAKAFVECVAEPRPGSVYNLGGGRENSISVLEAIAALEKRGESSLSWQYIDRPRRGDHVWYVSDCRKFMRDYPQWRAAWSLERIIDQLMQVSGGTGERS